MYDYLNNYQFNHDTVLSIIFCRMQLSNYAARRKYNFLSELAVLIKRTAGAPTQSLFFYIAWTQYHATRNEMPLFNRRNRSAAHSPTEEGLLQARLLGVYLGHRAGTP